MPVRSHQELTDLCCRLLRSAGASRGVANKVARHLVGSNLVGIDSHGIMRLADYVSWLLEGKVPGDDQLEILKDHNAACLIDAHFTLGPVAISKAAEMVAGKAEKYGVGLASVKNSSHTGRLGEYVEDLALRGFIGFLCCNAQGAGQFVAPWRGKQARLTTNPMAWGFPSGRECGPMVLDMATSVVPEGKVRFSLSCGQNIPEGWVITSDGRPTTNPADLYEAPEGAILPFGAHKGYGLALVVEMLSGGLSGGGCSRPVSERFTHGNAFLLMAIQVETFRSTTDFTGDVDDMLRYVKSCAPVNPREQVLVPYEIESTERQRKLEEGISIPDAIWEKIEQLAAELNVPM